MKKLLLVLFIAGSAQACILDRAEVKLKDVGCKHPKKLSLVAGGVVGAVATKYVVPKVIDYGKRAYNWIKGKLS